MIKSLFAFFSVKNSGLKTIFSEEYFFENFNEVPGITVDLINIMQSFLMQSLIFFKTISKVSKLMEPSLFAGVGTEIKTKSESFIVSDKEFVEISGLIS